MPVGELLSDQVARIQDAVNSVYTPKELEAVTHSRRHAYQTQSSSIDWADSDSESDGSLESIASGDTDDLFCTKRRAKDLNGIVAEGRDRLRHLEKRLKTQQRVQVIKSLSEWFEHRAPEVSKAIDDLNDLEARRNDEEVAKAASSTEEATGALESEVMHVHDKVDQFYHHLLEEVGGIQGLQRVEEERRELMQECSQAGSEEKEDQHLQKANEELSQLQERYQVINNPLHGLEASDHSEQDRIRELKEAIAAKKTRLDDLQRSVDENGYRTMQLQKILSAIRMENRGGLSTLEPGLQKMVAQLKEKVYKGAEKEVERDETILLARVKADSEEREAERLGLKAQELEAEAKSRRGIMRLVLAEERERASNAAREEVLIPPHFRLRGDDSSGTEEDDDEETSSRMQAEHVEVLQQLRGKRSELQNLEACVASAKAKAEALEQAKCEVRRNLRLALEKLGQEEETSLLEAVRAGRPAVETPTEWRQHLDQSWEFAKQNPTLFACCLGLDTISDEGGGYIFGNSRNVESGNASSVASTGERRSSAHYEGLAELRKGHMDLWKRITSMEEGLCLRKPSEQDQDEGRRVKESVEKLQDALVLEDMLERGNLTSVAEEGMRDAFGIQWLAKKLVPLAKRTPRRRATGSPCGSRSPRRRH